MRLPRAIVVYLLAFSILLPPGAFAASPTAEVRSAIDRVVKILSDPKLKADAKKDERRKLLRQAIFSRFDFREMAKRSLGAQWRRLTPEEQDEFVQLFTDLLEKAYLDRIESYSDEKFVYMGQNIDQGYAEVYSKVLTSKGEEFKIDYRLHRGGEEWRIHDIIVENISLVNNYRSQFNRIIANSSYEELLRRMKEKQVEISQVKGKQGS